MQPPITTASDNEVNASSILAEPCENNQYGSEASDAELIRQYNATKSPKTFETLLRRHYNTVHKRLLSITRNAADADDLSQKLWLRVLENLPNYQDKQKFPHFLNTVASNLVKDEWRRSGVRNEGSLDQLMDDGNQHIEVIENEEDIVSNLGNRSEITYLVKTLIPKLEPKLRAVFLLRHESEYWDGKQPFQWQHLAELNGVEESVAYQHYLACRDDLITGNVDADQLDAEQRMYFLVWTQAQRYDKASKQTETYLASLLGIPVNTFKTRYRAALAELAGGLESWRGKESV